jgi:hypothetical protein
VSFIFTESIAHFIPVRSHLPKAQRKAMGFRMPGHIIMHLKSWMHLFASYNVIVGFECNPPRSSETGSNIAGSAKGIEAKVRGVSNLPLTLVLRVDRSLSVVEAQPLRPVRK